MLSVSVSSANFGSSAFLLQRNACVGSLPFVPLLETLVRFPRCPSTGGLRYYEENPVDFAAGDLFIIPRAYQKCVVRKLCRVHVPATWHTVDRAGFQGQFDVQFVQQQLYAGLLDRLASNTTYCCRAAERLKHRGRWLV